MNESKRALKFGILFEEYVASVTNEGLSKMTASKSKELLDLAEKDDVDDFIVVFSDEYGTAADMWMSEGDWRRLMKMYTDHEFITLGGESRDGASDSKTEKLISDGWKIFADEQNEGSYDCIMYK